jgi:predicted Holliday junction resolvase-like endonuclease
MSSTFLGFVVGLAGGLGVAGVAFLIWKFRHTRAVRADAVRRSQAVTRGKVQEQLVPFFPDFPFSAQDARFLGSPVDFVIFDGLSDGALRRVVLLEIKTGGAQLTPRERQIRDAVQAGRVQWQELRLGAGPHQP